MKRHRVRISRQDFDELRRLVLANMPDEASAFALVGINETTKYVDVLVRRIVPIPRRMIVVQNDYHLEIAAQAINGLISLCESNQLGAIICHSHPDGLQYSPSDDYGEGRIVDTLRRFVPFNAPTASLLFTPDAVTGRVWLRDSPAPVPLSGIVVVGHHIETIQLWKADWQNSPRLELYDRQVRAFGSHGQISVSGAKVAIVGVGGTGSSVAEQLVRLGVLDMVLVDPDKFDKTNLTRVYGTYASNDRRFLGGAKHKVDLIAAHLRKINASLTIHRVPLNVVLTAAASVLLDRDIIFLCTDEHWGRSIVNQIAYQFLIPTINIGLRITSENGIITNAVGTLDILRPDKPCLWCKQFLSSERIAVESMPMAERQSRFEEGYVEGIDTRTPSVISFTTNIASTAVSLFIHLLTNYMGTGGDVSRIGYDYLIGGTMRGTTITDKNCLCSRTKGFGAMKSLPTLQKL